MLTVGVVLAIMILPIITALCREVFLQTPRLHEEAALALGATRWEMIRMTVFPYARSGMVSAAMLGLGRALGETMAVAMVLSATDIVTFNLISCPEPEHDRRQHRAEVPRGNRHRGQRPDRHRPGPLRDHLRRQLRSPARSSAGAKSSREPTDMSTAAEDRTAPRELAPGEVGRSLYGSQLSRAFSSALVVIGVAVAALCEVGGTGIGARRRHRLGLPHRRAGARLRRASKARARSRTGSPPR